MRRGWLIVNGLLTLGTILPALEIPAALPTAGADHHAVVTALIALGRGDIDPLTGLSPQLLSAAPAISEPQDPALDRRWPLLVPAALARLPATQRAVLAARLDERFRSAGPSAIPWDYLPASAAQAALNQLVSRLFDHGQLMPVLLLAPADPRAAAARQLLGLGDGTLADPALPVPRDGAPPTVPNGMLLRGDGWLFGLDPAGRVRWQRRTERLARIAVGLDGALVAETAGLAAIDLDGASRALPPLPPFARPLMIHGGVAWFSAGRTAWCLDVAHGSAEPQQLELPEAPLGPPLQRGDTAWWLTRSALLVSRHGVLTLRLPHLLALSTVATLERHPHGAVIRDGARWWLVTTHQEAPVLAQIEALLLSDRRAAATELLATLPISERLGEAARALAVRVTAREPRTAQEHALVSMFHHTDPEPLRGNPLLSETATDLALPVSAWPLRFTLTAWRQRADGKPPTVALHADATTVTLRAQWPTGVTEETGRWWERTWPTRPLLDAPSRTWSLNGDSLAVADGAGHILVVETSTGQRIVEADVPTDVDPADVVRCGTAGAALLADLGRTLIIINDRAVRSITLNPPAVSLAGGPDAVTVTTAQSTTTIPLR